VHDPVLANKLSALARKVTWEDGYGPLTTCGRKVRLACGPDLDGDGLPEAIVEVTWKVMLNGRMCATVRDNNDYWTAKRFFLISGNAQEQKAVAALEHESEEFPGSNGSAWFVRLRDGRAGVATSHVSEASDSGCESGATIRYAMEHGGLREMETEIDDPPCPR